MERSIATRDPGRNKPSIGLTPTLTLTLGLVWVVGLATVHAASRAVAAGDDPAADAGNDADVQVLTQGPVHEAFAAPVVDDPEPGLIVPKAPPAAVEELPPDQKPAGANVQWIAGYWSWDQSRDDFVWVSGVWREPPPGRQWVPGYWNPSPGGHQWVPGAWIPIDATANSPGLPTAQGQAAYLPAPPPSLEVGPNAPPPAGEFFWSPGCWSWRHSHGRYLWRPGFWTVARPGWVWAPAHYVWTPGGFLFVDGYWDLPLASRGMLFAPVYYARPVYLRPAYVFTPSILIATPGLVANLFVQPRYNHYVFGDFYDRRFLTVGIFPWCAPTRVWGSRPVAFHDPLFTYYAMSHARTNPGWAAGLRADYALRRDHVAMRPPRTYVEQTRIVQNNVNVTRNLTVVNPGGRAADRELGRPMAQIATRQGEVAMERLNAESRRQWRDQSLRLAEFRSQRAGREAAAAPTATRGGAPAPAPAAPRARPFAMSQSPVAAPAAPPPTANRPLRPAFPARPQPQPQPQAQPRPGPQPARPSVQPGGATRPPSPPSAGMRGGMVPRRPPPTPRPNQPSFLENRARRPEPGTPRFAPRPQRGERGREPSAR